MASDGCCRGRQHTPRSSPHLAQQRHLISPQKSLRCLRPLREKKKIYGSTNQTIRTRDSGVESAVFYDVVPETLRWCVNSDLNFAPRQVSVVDRWVRIYLSLVRFKHGGYEIDEMWGLCFLVCVLSSGQETNTNNIIVFISS